MYQLRTLERVKSSVSAGLIFSIAMQLFGVLLLQIVLLYPQAVEAAEVVIDSTVSTNAAANTFAGAQTAFTDDQTGYTFYRDSNNTCVYSKTTDGGNTWGSAVTVDSQTDCLEIVIWYDRWTPGDSTGNYIHISTMDSGDDDLFYNRLDTTSDTLLMGSAPVNVSTSSGQVPSLANTVNAQTITKATDGKIYMAVNDVSDSFVVSCSASCETESNWTEVGTSPYDSTNDFNLLVPLSGGNVMTINRDISADDIRSAIWDGANWSGWTNIDINAPENSTFDVGMSVTVDVDTGSIYLAYVADNNDMVTADHDIRTAVYTSGVWTNKTDVLTNVSGRGIHNTAIAYDQNKGDVYVSYAIEDTIGTPTSANIYWKKSTDGMTTWGTEQGPINTTSGNIYGPSLNLNSHERIYATWYDPAVNDRFGNTVADIGPDTILASIGTQVSSIKTNDTGVYLGGAFTVKSISSRTISTFKITEKGTVDAQNDLNNIKLFYDLDVSFPYDCVSESYSGGESQFGVTDTNGFSGVDGTSNFTGSIVNVTPTQTMCVYVVLDVLSTANDTDTIEIEVTNPSTDVTVSGETVYPATSIEIASTTNIVSPDLTQIHYHWRNDDGTESGATSATAGAEDTPISSLIKETPIRLRMEVSNEGSTSTDATFQLEYGLAAPTCGDVASWTDVGATDDAWNMYPTANLNDGDSTTDISNTIGGVTFENSNFLSPNYGVKDAFSTTSSLTLDTIDYVELEFSLVASSSAVEGETYCFRLTDSGTPLNTYSVIPQATISADIIAAAVGTHITNADIPTTAAYLGGSFSLKSTSGSHTITNVTITETGTIDASTGLSNIKLFYESDLSNPYDCTSESYAGTETQFGGTDTDGFSGPNGTSTFSDSVGITATSTLCLYVVSDITTLPINGETVSFQITSPTSDVVAGASSVAPGTPISITASTTLQGGLLTQTHYHWRYNNGGESTSTSATFGNEDTPVTDFDLSSKIRLRLGVSNEGATSSVATRFRLDYAPKITTCDVVSVWTDVNGVADDSWDMTDSIYLTNGEDTANIAEAIGGLTDENSNYLSSNGGVRDTESLTASTTLTELNYVDLEYSIKSTISTPNDATFCFRVSANGTSLPAYTNYAEITTAKKRDFKVQRGTTTISGTSVTLVAGVDYDVPQVATSSFIRITNSHYTGAGDTTLGGAQNADDVTAYISNPENILTSVTFNRLGAVNDTYIDWEIVEFVGTPSTDNEMVVRDVGSVTISSGALVATGTTISVTDDSDVVVYITGIRNRNTSRNYYAGQVTSAWDAASDAPVFTRGATGGSIVDVSYAVVEYVGMNWNIQRAEHTYTASGVPEPEAITPVGSLSQTFIHAQKRMGASTNVVHFGHTVWLPSISYLSLELETGADTGVGQTAVVWIIENTQTGSNAMQVQRLSGNTSGGAEPLILEIGIPIHLDSSSNSSIFVSSRAAGTNNGYPRPIMGARITSTSTLELWRSDTGTTLNYRIELVEWPVADLAQRQNYYRFYVDNDALTPSDPWPAGATNLGENTSITDADDPPGADVYLRLRMSVRIANANLPAGFQQYKLQYAERAVTCSATTDWHDLGDTASSSIWRGYPGSGTSDGDNLSSDPYLPGDLLISVSDVAGRLEHENPSAVNSYPVLDGEDVEYDWYIQHNGANPDTVYCFRMIKDDGLLLEGYLNYPQIKTAGFQPASKNWQWYDDPDNETPASPAAAENVTPSNIAIDDTLALRVTVKELSNVPGADIKYKLQFSDDINFVNPVDVVATSSCVENSLWCYYEGGGVDNDLITTSLLTDGDGCIGGAGNGCGTHNESATYVNGHLHGATRAQEYSFTIKQAGARVNAIYYFRLVEILSSDVVILDTSETYPSVQVGPSTLSFSVAGLPAGTTTASVVTDATTTATSVGFGSIPFNNDQIAAQRISISTNATEGYQVLQYAGQDLTSSNGTTINSVSSTNATPSGWATACLGTATGCIGYHTTDAILEGGSARFAPSDTYAPLHTDPQEIIYSSVPVDSTEDVVYRVMVTEMQPAGDYETNIVYIAVPVF